METCGMMYLKTNSHLNFLLISKFSEFQWKKIGSWFGFLRMSGFDFKKIGGSPLDILYMMTCNTCRWVKNLHVWIISSVKTLSMFGLAFTYNRSKFSVNLPNFMKKYNFLRNQINIFRYIRVTYTYFFCQGICLFLIYFFI